MPAATMATPPLRATHSPLGRSFSATTKTVIAATQARFITPPTKRSPITKPQQPRQKAPWPTPMRNAPALPGRQCPMMKAKGLRQCLRQAYLRGVH